MSAKPQTVSILGGAILQRLTRAPMSGYALKKLFTTSAGYGWHAYDTQIYRELKALERNGLVAGRAEEGRAGPQRRVYTPTQAGLQALRRWLESPLDESWHKSELTMRIWALDLIPPDALSGLVADVRQQTQAQLEHMTNRRDELRRQYGPPELTTDPRQVGRQLVLDYDIEVSRLKLAWIERVETVARVRERLAASRNGERGPSEADALTPATDGAAHSGPNGTPPLAPASSAKASARARATRAQSARHPARRTDRPRPG